MSEFQRVKANIKIEDYIGTVLELKESGANLKACCPFHGEQTPSFTISPSKQIFKCMGCGIGGDIFDFVKEYNHVTDIDALNIIKRYNNDTYQPNRHTYTQSAAVKPLEKKNEIEIKTNLDHLAKQILGNNYKLKVFSFINYDGSTEISSSCYIHEKFQKLFEKKELFISQDNKKQLEYILKNILSFDTYFQCPAIIMRDDLGKVCDIARYRPVKPLKFDSWSDPKYMYMSDLKKLDNRGKDFLFPFSREMKRLIDKHSFFFIGEGLKNGFIALVHGIPFISLESASNGLSEELAAYIKELTKTKEMYGAFDGDYGLMKRNDTDVYTKGKGAYEKTKEELGIDFKNIFDFSTGIDFADALKDEANLTTFNAAKFFNLTTTKRNEKK